MTATMKREIDDRYARGISWDGVLNCRSKTQAWVPADEGGRATREPRATDYVAVGGSGDPMWTPQGESRVYIGELNPTHRFHLYKWLLKRASSIAYSCTFTWTIGPFAPMGDAACDAVDELTEWIWDHPQEWLISTPFMMALEALIIGDGGRDELEVIHREIDERVGIE